MVRMLCKVEEAGMPETAEKHGFTPNTLCDNPSTAE